jgi:hypothetical protein
MEFENGIDYPIEKAEFILRNLTFSEEHIALELDNKFIDKRNAITTLTADVAMSYDGPTFQLSIFCHRDDREIKKNSITILRKII